MIKDENKNQKNECQVIKVVKTAMDTLADGFQVVDDCTFSQKLDSFKPDCVQESIEWLNHIDLITFTKGKWHSPYRSFQKKCMIHLRNGNETLRCL